MSGSDVRPQAEVRIAVQLSCTTEDDRLAHQSCWDRQTQIKTWRPAFKLYRPHIKFLRSCWKRGYIDSIARGCAVIAGILALSWCSARGVLKHKGKIAYNFHRLLTLVFVCGISFASASEIPGGNSSPAVTTDREIA